MKRVKVTYTVDQQIEIHNAIADIFRRVDRNRLRDKPYKGGISPKMNIHLMRIKNKMTAKNEETMTLTEKQLSTIKWVLSKYLT